MAIADDIVDLVKVLKCPDCGDVVVAGTMSEHRKTCAAALIKAEMRNLKGGSNKKKKRPPKYSPGQGYEIGQRLYIADGNGSLHRAPVQGSQKIIGDRRYFWEGGRVRFQRITKQRVIAPATIDEGE